MAAGKYVLAASTGGHLSQLARLAPRLGATCDSLWVTFRSAQSEQLLGDRRVVYVPYISPRDFVGVSRAFRIVLRSLRRESFDGVVSTGAALAVGVMAAARLEGVPSAYVESVSRVQGPSLSGRIIAGTHLARTYTQHAHWASRRWLAVEGVLADFNAVITGERVIRPRMFVTLGTIAPFRFDALVDGVLKTGLANEDTVWQLGVTQRRDLPGRVFTELKGDAFAAEAARADVVISHAGVGTLLGLLDMGIRPVLVPRRKASGEHVDDHQIQIAEYAARRDLAFVSAPAGLSPDILIEATGHGILPVHDGPAGSPRPLRLFT
jgi:UDP-N-acetylglucosamine--N-acetylmuramyl-(pentapeptide) pyrophosphoryl-undecaprenol N-acetylglucosamine transferase